MNLPLGSKVEALLSTLVTSNGALTDALLRLAESMNHLAEALDETADQVDRRAQKRATK